MDYTDLQPIIDELGVDVTVKTTTLSTINEYGEETRTSTTSTVRMLIQKYNRETHNLDGLPIETEPELIAYLLESIDKNSIVNYNSQDFKIIDIYYQPLGSTYLYYRLGLKKIV